MRILASIIAGSALLLVGPAPASAGCGSTGVTQMGALTGDPEKDTFGLDCTARDVDRTGSVPRHAGLPIGASTGDAEKDTLGYGVTAGAE